MALKRPWEAGLTLKFNYFRYLQRYCGFLKPFDPMIPANREIYIHWHVYKKPSAFCHYIVGNVADGKDYWFRKLRYLERLPWLGFLYLVFSLLRSARLFISVEDAFQKMDLV